MKNPDVVTSTHVYFWSGIYSQWYTRPNLILENDVSYNSAEKYMMVKKALLFNDTEIATKMLKSNNPRTVKALGRKVKNFTQSVWESNRLDIVTQASILKFTQNQDLLRQMQAHSALTLVEASPYDLIWGVGLLPSDVTILDSKNWKGQNLLGQCLMTARTTILANNKEK